MTAQIAYLHEHRPLPPVSPEQTLARRIVIAREVLRDPDMHRPVFVRECCRLLIEHDRPYDVDAATAQMSLMDARDCRQARCAAPPPAVTMTRREAIAEAASFLAVLASAAFAVGMMIYVLAVV